MWKTLKRSLPDVDRDDLLEALGLESRRSAADRWATSLALFGAGVAVGLGLGLVLAPKPGRELRDDLRQRLSRGEPQVSNGPKVAPDTQRPA